MRRNTILIIMLAGGMLTQMPVAMRAQPPQPAEPEYAGAVYYLDSTGRLVPLESQPGNARMKTKAMGFGGGTMLVTFKEARSPVRLKSDPQLELVVRLEAGSLDPALVVNLNVLLSNKNNREAAIAKAGPMGFGAKTTQGDSSIKLTFVKYGDHSVKFTAAEKLPSGEYVVSTKATGKQGFLFGVD